ncbi:hypothetical protein BDK51DRAFT_39921 [Blyttiomyces helicus]|uniref:Major facilitator superfamily domain-containing protein n=1 Tax=Blyttiomyces helicus TaxID=388810 RepID=A0A4P9WBE7_9FUNG|nr:hypothetical protein BDK51DRAFT_39921 [Blyttiomyces helicus]|eukprot:RKO88873.1 hypothetical protein BDK51DRAFT_39921 [Blyttiomyces helicus]
MSALKYIQYIPALLLIPYLGAYSDRFGRIPILKTTINSCGIWALSYLMAATWRSSLAYGFLVLMSLAQASQGSPMLMLPIAAAYVADTTKKSDRTRVLIAVGAVYYAAGAFTYAIGLFLFGARVSLIIEGQAGQPGVNRKPSDTSVGRLAS